MLEELPQASIAQKVHRFANISRLRQLAESKGLTIDQITDVIAFEREDVIKQLMDEPFQRKPFFGNKFGRQSRFSDGDWPVFYTAIGPKTAQEESTYQYGRKAAGDGSARRPVHYSILRCEFSGSIIDLRPKLSDWPDLVSDDYMFCIALGKEGNDLNVGGFFNPSARDKGGTTVPAFKRETLKGPIIEATAKLTFSEDTTVVEIAEMS